MQFKPSLLFSLFFVRMFFFFIICLPLPSILKMDPVDSPTFCINSCTFPAF